jgi:tRNA A-37 threonylcarbamoyl transferase component Bud32
MSRRVKSIKAAHRNKPYIRVRDESNREMILNFSTGNLVDASKATGRLITAVASGPHTKPITKQALTKSLQVDLSEDKLSFLLKNLVLKQSQSKSQQAKSTSDQLAAQRQTQQQSRMRRSKLTGIITDPEDLESFFKKSMKELGSGNFGTVYKVERKEREKSPFGVPVPKHMAMKEMMQKGDVTLHKIRKAVEQEILAVRNLSSPFVMRYYGAFLDKERILIFTEFIEGVSLKVVIRDNVTYKAPVRQGIVLDLRDALKYIHGQGVVHRDLKPDNVMVKLLPGGRYLAKLVDFGFALDYAQTKQTSYKGSLLYSWTYYVYIMKYPEKAEPVLFEILRLQDWWAFLLMVVELSGYPRRTLDILFYSQLAQIVESTKDPRKLSARMLQFYKPSYSGISVESTIDYRKLEPKELVPLFKLLTGLGKAAPGKVDKRWFKNQTNAIDAVLDAVI